MADLADNSKPSATVERLPDEGGRPVVRITGEIDLAVAAVVGQAIDQALEPAPGAVIFDLEHLRFMDSSGIALFLALVDRGVTVDVRNPSPAVRRVLEVTGLATLFNMK